MSPDEMYELRRKDDAILTELMRQLNINSGLIAKVLEKQEHADRRQDAEDLAHSEIWKKVDILDKTLAAMPPELHMEHHKFITELHEEVMARRDREREKLQFWKNARDRLFEQGLIKVTGFLIVGFIGVFWSDVRDWVVKIYIGLTH